MERYHTVKTGVLKWHPVGVNRGPHPQVLKYTLEFEHNTLEFEHNTLEFEHNTKEC